MKQAYLLLVLLTLLLGGCISARPDLTRLYEQPTERRFYNPVIVIHGFLGSRLRARDSRAQLWPPRISEVLNYETYRLALPINADSLTPEPSPIEAHAVFEQLAGFDFYGKLLQTLSRQGGYRFTRPGTPANSAERRYYTFVYDWRQDIVESARGLDRLITQIRRDYGQADLQVDIVAHSMGGLITRYYARYGTADVLGGNEFRPTQYGSSRIRKAVLMGTPNLGSVSAVHTYITGFGFGALGLPAEVLTTMPSVFQLFPHPVVPWLVDINGKILREDVYDIALWKKFGWGMFDPIVVKRVIESEPDPEQGRARLALLQQYFGKYLERGERLAWALSGKPKDNGLNYVVFGGDCELTPAHLLLEMEDGTYRARLTPENIINPQDEVNYDRVMMQPGDGRVTKPSLLSRESLDPTATRSSNIYLPLHHSIMFCEVHDRLTGNVHFQDNLLNILLTAD